MKHINQKFWGNSIVGEKGQIVIPANARKEFDLKPQDQVVVFGNEKIMHVVKADQLDVVFDTVAECFSDRLETIRQDIKKDLKEKKK